MRPTDLQFRSPKEFTPSPYDVRATRSGKALDYSARSSSIGRGRRFRQYEIDAKRVGQLVGPGAYNADALSIGKARIVGGCRYSVLYIDQTLHATSYAYTGNHLIPENRPSSVIGRRRSSADVHAMVVNERNPSRPLVVRHF